jgi:hypothetical protein
MPVLIKMLRPERQLLPMETLRQGKQPSAKVVDDQKNGVAQRADLILEYREEGRTEG